MNEDDERIVELSSIAAIFPELVLDEQDPYHAILDILVTPEKPLKIYFQSSTQAAPLSALTPPSTASGGNDVVAKREGTTVSSAALNIDVHQLKHLPPLKLDIKLPLGYPQQKPPDVGVFADQMWLPAKTLDGIKSKCAELWEEAGQDQVIYTFIDYVQQEAERAFDLADNRDNKFELPANMKLILLDYDHKRRTEQFENETFDCGICLEPKKGRICHQMSLCYHVFCVACLQDFYNACIEEGDVDNVKCMAPGCGKELSNQLNPSKKRKIDLTLNPSELLQVPIKQEVVQRYVRLKRKKRLEADKNTIYCPRQWCQGAAKSKRHPKGDDPLHQDELSESDVEVDPESLTKSKKRTKGKEIPMSERLSVCEDCNFAFCSVCKKGWHGELATCNPRRQVELNEEERASLEYLMKFSTPCPTCSAPAQKSYGCNHMICFKCKTHFCYLCSSYLMPENPYKHFNDLKSPCYMRLWELEGGDGADVGIGFGGGNAVPWEPEEESDEEDDDDDDDLPAENMNDFNGPPPANWDDDSEDEEPAPDQRRPDRPNLAHIELVNFAGNGAPRRIEVEAQRAPPAVPEPPVIPNRRRRPARRVPAHIAIARAPQGLPVPRIAQAPPAIHVLAAPGQGNNPGPGLQQFLRLALADREDEWDSDEDD